MKKKMPKTIIPTDLLSEARSLFAESQTPSFDASSLVERVRQFGEQLRAAKKHGLFLIEPAYHKAAQIYTDKLLLAVVEHLSLGESNPITYNPRLAELV